MQIRERVRSRRRTSVLAAAALAAVVAAAVAYRVLAPAEVATPVRSDYPPLATARPGVLGTLSAAPLIVDGRLRVYGTARQVRADQPVDAKTQRTPYWSYRRWPAQLTGIVASAATIVSHWSDGQVVALDARTGRVSWRTTGPGPDQGYEGRGSGAATAYAPAGLYTATAAAGQRVVIVSAAAELRGIDLGTGRELWRAAVDQSCRAGGFTTTDGRFVSVDTCASPQAAEFLDVSTGASAGRWRPAGAGPVVAVAPVGCAIGRSACAGMRTTSDGRSSGWLVDGPEPVPAPALDPAGSWLVGDVAVAADGADLVARSAGSGIELWRRTDRAPVQVVAVQPGRVHLLTSANELVTREATSGAEMSRFLLTYGDEKTTWSPGYVYASDGFVAVERLARPVRPDADDRQYYVRPRPVILAGT